MSTLFFLIAVGYLVLLVIGALQDYEQRDYRRRTGDRNPRSGPYGRGPL